MSAILFPFEPFAILFILSRSWHLHSPVALVDFAPDDISSRPCWANGAWLLSLLLALTWLGYTDQALLGPRPVFHSMWCLVRNRARFSVSADEN